MSTLTLEDRAADRRFFIFNAIVSVAALSFLSWLLLINTGASAGQWDLRFMPAVNASLNALAFVLLGAGVVAIKSGRRRVHGYLMSSAFATSAIFLVCYVAYHFAHGHTKYGGEGALKAIYLLILFSHIVLSTVIVPMALTAFYFAARGQYARHKKVTRVLAPIWMYVSVTGVAIFFLLRGAPTSG
jgi:putative membrane protein